MPAAGEQARLAYEAQCVPAFARALPGRPCQRWMTRKDDGMGDVTGRCPQRQRVSNTEQPAKLRTLICGGADPWWQCARFSRCSTRIERGCTETDIQKVVMGKQDARGSLAGRVTQA